MSSGPTFWTDDGRLYARTSLFWQVLTLGLWCRWVTVDPHAGEVVISRRYFWSFLRERHIPFKAISHIEYRYAGPPLRLPMISLPTDSLESYSLSLALQN